MKLFKIETKITNNNLSEKFSVFQTQLIIRMDANYLGNKWNWH